MTVSSLYCGALEYVAQRKLNTSAQSSTSSFAILSSSKRTEITWLFVTAPSAAASITVMWDELVSGRAW